MPKKRDYISEILSKKQRTLKRADRWVQFIRRYDQVMTAFDFLDEFGSKNPQARTELLKYIYIGTGACLEGYYRMIIRDLINYGEPYQLNAQKLDDIKIDISTVLGLGREKISVGEFISHLVSLSSLEDINRHLSILLGEDFLRRLWTTKNEMGYDMEFMAPSLIQDMQSIFRYRHIFCHEIAFKEKPLIGETRNLISAALLVTSQSELLIQNLIGAVTEKAVQSNTGTP